jgi:pyruvate/2-oxoacid:ferredoxin oxidoreductase alpha subunit
LVPWGGSKGPALDAYRTLKSLDIDLAWYYTMYIHPMPKAMIKDLREKELVLVPELNFMGQFASVLRSEGINAIPITQYTGLPFKMRDLVSRVRSSIEQYVKEGSAK